MKETRDMMDAVGLIGMGYDPEQAVQEMCEDAQFMIQDLASDLRSQRNLLEALYAKQEMPEAVYNTITAIRYCVVALDAAEDHLVRFM
jgi:hypothetical protein